VVVRQAVRLNGLTSLAITKLDVLTGFKKLRVCVAYDLDGKRIDDVPASATAFGRAQPIYEEFPGWDEPLARARTIDDLPENARRYIKCLEDLTGIGAVMISVGARREDTISLGNAFNG
jgi:adenylosuccinate synthase